MLQLFSSFYLARQISFGPYHPFLNQEVWIHNTPMSQVIGYQQFSELWVNFIPAVSTI